MAARRDELMRMAALVLLSLALTWAGLSAGAAAADVAAEAAFVQRI